MLYSVYGDGKNHKSSIFETDKQPTEPSLCEITTFWATLTIDFQEGTALGSLQVKSSNTFPILLHSKLFKIIIMLWIEMHESLKIVNQMSQYSTEVKSYFKIYKLELMWRKIDVFVYRQMTAHL